MRFLTNYKDFMWPFHLIQIIQCITESRSKEDPYEYHIEADHESLTGHIRHDAERGSKVTAEVETTEGHAEGEEQKEDIYLKVIIKQAEKTLPPQKVGQRICGVF